MALPTKQKTWIVSPCNRVVYVSLNDAMSKVLFGYKAFLKANGYTVAGSCDGTTGAIDGVDRWAAAANAATRFNGAGGAQSWILLVDGNGAQILIAYQGASDDIARISFSPGALFVVAGTPNQQPTATDEQVAFSGATGSLIDSTASGDRLWSGWVSSDHKMCRFAIARGGQWVGGLFGIELVTSKIANGPVFTPAIWGFGFGVTANALPGGAAAGKARVVVASVGKNASCSFGAFCYQGNYAFFGNVKPDAQGGVGFATLPLGIGSATAGIVGPIAMLIDWWVERSNAPHASVTSGLEFITMAGVHTASAGQDGGLWPWDSVTTPVMT